MKINEKGSFDIAKGAFASIEALVKDAHGNAICDGNDPKRIHIGAGYMRLCAMKSSALADLLDAVANGNYRDGDNAKTRLFALEHQIKKYLNKVAVDDERWVTE